MKKLGWSSCWVVVVMGVAWAQEAAPKGRYAPMAGEDRVRAARVRDTFEELAGACDRYGSFVADDVVLARRASEAAAAVLERAVAAWERDDEKEGWRIRKEFEPAEQVVELWRQRVWEWRRRQAEAAPDERQFIDTLRWLPEGAYGELSEWIRVRKAASAACGVVAEAMVPGADGEKLHELKEKAFALEGECEIARWRFDWGRQREQIWSDKKVKSDELVRNLEDLRQTQEERIKLRRAEIERDRRVREVERKMKQAETESRKAFAAAKEARERAGRR
jgi:hypothetical protein